MPRNRYHDTPVVEFHEAFGAPVAWSPAVPAEDRRELRCKLLLEEVLEFITASGANLCVNGQDIMFQNVSLVWPNMPNLVEAADALADIRYVTDGAALEWGIPLEKCLREVHRSNMSKLGEDGKPLLREDGKILKGPHYTPPALGEILELYKGVNNAS
jgi:predicted HAD superfamily Cof-like phosphohydrolase